MTKCQYRAGSERRTLHPIEAAGHTSGMPEAITEVGTWPAYCSPQLPLGNGHRAAALYHFRDGAPPATQCHLTL